MTIDELLAAAGLTANDEIPIWDKESTGEPTKKITVANLASAVVALANLVTGVKGDKESNYRHDNVNLTPANIGAVNKAGDTMTGGLILYATQPELALKNDTYIKGTNPSSALWNVINSYDKNRQRVGVIHQNFDAYGNSTWEMEIQKKVNDTEYYGGFRVRSSMSSTSTNQLMYNIDTKALTGGNWQGDTIDIPHGGTGATKAADARVNLGITGVEIPLLSNPLAINNGGLQYTANYDNEFADFKFVDLYFIVQNGYTNAIRLCPEYGDKTYKFGFFAWNLGDNVLRKVAVTFETAGRHFANCVVRAAYGDNGTFNTANDFLYLYKAIGYKW